MTGGPVLGVPQVILILVVASDLAWRSARYGDSEPEIV